jgi:hypothetical protein
MNKKNHQARGRDQEIDRLLRETLRDDPPAGLEQRLERHWEAFQDRASREAVRVRRSAKGGHEDPLRWFLLASKRLLPKGALAAAAVGMVVWGILMQAGGSSHVLANNLSLIKTTVLVKDQVSLAPALSCRVEVSDGSGGGRLAYLVQWLPPDLQRVDMWDRDGDPVRTVWVRDQIIIVADRGTERVYSVGDLGQIDDPYLPAILELIQPQELANRLYGEWEESRRELRENCIWSTFQIASLDEHRDTFDLTVDLCDYRPVEIRRVLDASALSQEGGRVTLHFRLTWDTEIPKERMIPEKQTIPWEV